MADKVKHWPDRSNWYARDRDGTLMADKDITEGQAIREVWEEPEMMTISLTREEAMEIGRALLRVIAPVDKRGGVFTFNILTSERLKIKSFIDKLSPA